jgi:DNA-directed RNA polymerase specialized sigma24 family protein
MRFRYMATSRSLDPLLRGFLYAPEGEFQAGLTRVLSELAQPTVNAIVSSRRRGEDAESGREVCEEVMARLVERLHRLRQSPAEEPVASFRDYVAAVTWHALAERWRREGCERRRRAPDGRGDLLAGLPDPRPDALSGLERRSRLRAVWREIGQLPARQVAALLLNLRDERGRGAIALLPLTGTAGMRQIAAVLDMTAERFAEIWQRLPIDDAAIATLLGTTRQQVINLRKSARKRLARRLGKPAL